MANVASDISCLRAATDILGNKWTPQLLRVFMAHEVVRFCQLQDEVGGINPRTLSARLVSLEEHNIIVKLPKQATTRCEYALTEKGKGLLPVLRSMELWSEQYS